MLPIDHSLMSHPSFFQTPVRDKELNDSPDLIRTTDPNSMWDPIALDKKKMFRQGPPLTREEKCRLATFLQPAFLQSLENEEPTVVFITFMSLQNIKELQGRIRAKVHEISGFKIGSQNENELLIVMQNVYTSYARVLDEVRVSKKALFPYVRCEVNRLNNIVVQLVVPVIINSAEQLTRSIELRDAGSNATSLPLPSSGSTYGMQEYRPVMDVLVGASSSVIAQTSSLHEP